MSNIRFSYLYRDGGNYKSRGEVIFSNLDSLSVEEIEFQVCENFLPDNLFIASQISVPEKFLFLGADFTDNDHCYHEFDCAEVCEEAPTDTLGRSVNDFVRDVEIASKQGWKAFDVLDRARLMFIEL